MIATLLALMPVFAAALPQEREQMRVRPSTEAQAVAEFETTCVTGLFDLEALKRGAAASSRGYAFADGGSVGWRQWTSSYGSIFYLQKGADATDVVPRCNMTSFTRAAVDRSALDKELRAMAKRQAAKGYKELRTNAGLSWSWTSRSGQPVTMEVALDRRTPHEVVLMLKPYATSR